MSDQYTTPPYYNTVMPYLILENPRAFLDFVKEVFNAEEKLLVPDENDPERGIMHAEFLIGDSTVMIGGSGGQWKPQPAGLYIQVESADESYQKALNAGATTVMELSDQEYGRTCGVKDPSGNTWWITSKQ